jgi:hypothetical protein
MGSDIGFNRRYAPMKIGKVLNHRHQSDGSSEWDGGETTPAIDATRRESLSYKPVSVRQIVMLPLYDETTGRRRKQSKFETNQCRSTTNAYVQFVTLTPSVAVVSRHCVDLRFDLPDDDDRITPATRLAY